MNKKWTEAQKDFIRVNAATMKDKDLAEKLTQMAGRNVSVQSVRKIRQKMGIKKKSGRGLCEVVGQENKGTPADVIQSAAKAVKQFGDTATAVIGHLGDED